jgi:SAM-dependent MidA family methyltransferase
VSEFDSATENTALKRLIVERIEAEGGISFAEYMRMALYHPRLGYYTGGRETIGRESDYLTSPEVSPLFGAMVGRQLREMWETMDRPPAFNIVEAGAGTGRLARDILDWASRVAREFLAAVRYTIVEHSEEAAERQRRLLSAEGLDSHADWTLQLPGAVDGCILSNELLDAMPVHRVAVRDGLLREIYVTWDDGHFTEELRDPSGEIAAYFDALGLLPGEGCVAEVNLEAPRWMREAAASLTRGFLLTLDYGYEAEELFAPWRTDGTLLGFYKHNPSADPYARIGRQDLTSHVDFTSVRRAGEQAGLTTLSVLMQSEFLANLGIAEALEPPASEAPDMEEYFARRRAAMELLDPGGLGRIRVMLQTKGTSAMFEDVR